MKTRIFVSLLFATVLALLLIFSNSKLSRFGDVALAQGNGPAPTPLNLMHMCEGTTVVPAGWIATDEQPDQACSYPSPGVTGRMLTIELYMQLLDTNGQVTVCADQPVPSGFIVAAFGKAAPKCASLQTDPNFANTNNLVKAIRLVPPSAAAKKNKPIAP